ncbi:DENN domain-containing protein 2C [Latimeria chalumnae]|uniref:DENN domain containing 2C n=1 Tax=Latimeria chalumnae TaxID=7897 RepID=H3BGA3_LATCH|nr:PREDICTED: DENN domain-containing protein 2C [Latimeria chalumnae]XP_005988515.1 PREDICTED: DENN domain-containing protein 2C [Latimeria chalumnae]XP_014352405.1 PREDICTED: DENN domain-containing protein 2C [Latimeria chalumnae]|eukprot:XP_005988514.1 PREDICTED: DENN domain-containing protein 2C [Latimeria chalumnae]
MRKHSPVMHSAVKTVNCSPSNGRPTSRNECMNIKQKISQWEGRTSGGSIADRQQPKETGLKIDNGHRVLSKIKPDASESNNKLGLAKAKSLGLDFREVKRSSDENQQQVVEKKVGHNLSNNQKIEMESNSVFSQVKKIDHLNKASPLDPGKLLPPGNFYTSRGFWKKMEGVTKEKDASFAADLKRKRESTSSVEKDVELKNVANQKNLSRNTDNIYSESEESEVWSTVGGVVNPVPKPQRTFRYLSDQESSVENSSSTDQSCKSSGVRPPLPSYPPPVSKKTGNGKLKAKSKRKSFEFEDAKGLHILLTAAGCEKVQKETTEPSKPALYHTLSEDSIYEDIICPTKENPYEDIKFSPLFLLRGSSAWKSPVLRRAFRPPKLPPKPSVLLRQTAESKSMKAEIPCKDSTGKSSLSPTSSEVKDSQARDCASRRKKKTSLLVLKIQDIFDAKRGKKKLKAQANLGHEVAQTKDENSETESDTEERKRTHSKRLVYVHSTLRRNTRYQTLERDLIELQERHQLFEFFVVVSLHKKPMGSSYIPQITQQFPNKFEKSTRQSRDAEGRLKAIPRFCFPDCKDWVPVDELTSETFSFVLTGEDGSRWFGYCQKILPSGKGKRLPEVYCIVSRLGCFNLFSKILDEVEKRRGISPALVYPFMRSVMEAPFPAPGRTITVKNFLPGSGNEIINLHRPADSRLEHVDFNSLLSCLSVCHLIQVFASLLLERRVIFVADKLSTLSKCCHAVVATLYPFTWQHTYIPVLPVSMIDIVCSPTPFLIGILSCSLPQLNDLPLEEVLIVDLCADRFLRQILDEDSILPHKLQPALEQILEQRNEILAQEQSAEEDGASLCTLVSEAFVRFFVEIVGHYSLHMSVNEKGERAFQPEAFRKSHPSRNVRQFLELFMETQMFAGFIQDRELRKSRIKGLFQRRVSEYLETIPEPEPSGVNKFFKGLGSKIKFLHKK